MLGDELFSDSFPLQLVDGVVYKVKGKVSDAAYSQWSTDRACCQTVMQYQNESNSCMLLFTYRAKVLGDKCRRL